ncbi:Lon protease family protein [Mailhella massiliensis]|uniref:endopeptidase La n=1 Tax=Mailhella massiliensis TaxID=1903261 RepID=A0A921AWC2_9BACT|nr:ATP-binding protein [Mailhella massiliensis]HJD97012.1 AAA family ATPase [Mailhella massiliensis]
MSPALKNIMSLPADRLRPSWPVDRIPWEDSRAIPRGGRRRPAQPRALAALELAVHIRNSGYNVYLAGSPDLGRTYMLCDFLEPLARKEATPPDIIYVNNFKDEDKPVLIQLPAGQGVQLKEALAEALRQMREELPARLDSDVFLRKRRAGREQFREERASVVKELERMAEEKGFALDAEEQGALSLFPMQEGKRLSDEEVALLAAPERQEFKRRADQLLQRMAPLVRRMGEMEKSFQKKEHELEREAAEYLFNRLVAPVAEKACRVSGCEEKTDALHTFFDDLRVDVLDHLELFLPREAPSAPHGETPSVPQEPDLYRYGVNVVVDNGDMSGAPVVVEDHPTYGNLLGCVERESEMGALVTDFTLIKAGSLHRANGGYLVLHINDLLSNGPAWEGLMRALRSGVARIEDPDFNDTSRVKGIEPEPMPLNLKVILVGEDELYEVLLERDERFAKQFKIKAQMTSETERTAPAVRAWLCQLARIMDEADLLPFDRETLAGLVDHGSELCEDHRKLSLRFPLMRETLIEASAMAAMAGKSMVDRASLDAALKARRNRSDLVEELFMEEYDRDVIKLRTSGSEVGCVNGLAVTTSGDYEFGLPHQISCTVGVGHGGIIDLEREAELGGPIHTKAMMILKSYLASQFAHDKPLVLSGSLCFEQSYNGIEGDSASGAELAALLSAISEVPLRLSLAFTGAVSQSGQIMAVGGVTRKIEGFFELCSRRGLTGEQGVILPKDNVEHLMLDEKVVNAVREGKFSIYPVTHIGEAMELLTGMPVGRRRKDGSFPKDTLFYKVDERLRDLGWLAEHSFKARRRKSRA